jgi:type IV secretory pathway VirD2 relaxase
MVARIEQHTGAPVECGGVVHRNTDHPHAHIIVRGRLTSSPDHVAIRRFSDKCGYADQTARMRG